MRATTNTSTPLGTSGPSGGSGPGTDWRGMTTAGCRHTPPGWCVVGSASPVGVDDVDADLLATGERTHDGAQRAGGPAATADHPAEVLGVDPHLQDVAVADVLGADAHVTIVVDDALDEVLQGLLEHDQPSALSVPISAPASADCLAAPPAGSKPAASAASAVRNHTSAVVWSYHCEPSTWYFIESLLPLTVKPTGAEPSSVTGAESGPKPPSTAAASTASATSVAGSAPSASAALPAAGASASAVASAGDSAATSAAAASSAFSWALDSSDLAASDFLSALASVLATSFLSAFASVLDSSALAVSSFLALRGVSAVLASLPSAAARAAS